MIFPGPLTTTSFAPKCTVFYIEFTRPFLFQLLSPLKKHLYISLVQSMMCYGSQLWRPHLKKNILAIQRVQCRATKQILLDYSSNYRVRLLELSMLPLMYWLELNDLMYFIKTLKYPSDNFSVVSFVSFSKIGTRASVAHKLVYNYSHTTTYRFTSID